MYKFLFKKMFYLILIVMLSLVLVSCKDDDEGDNKNDGLIVPELNVIEDNYRNWYEIFVYSFYDTNNDGIGDLNGVTEKLSYIKEMGFNGIWLMPIHPSPTYHKYDVNDYYAIDKAYGTLDDFKRLVEEAHKLDIKIILDLVVNHTSSDNPWFKGACEYIRQNGKPGGEYGEYYNFVTSNQGTGYSQVSGAPYYYEARFWSGMPDLNLNSAKVKEEIKNIMKYWLIDYDVDGFRLDAVTSYYTGNVDKNVEFLSWLNTEAKKIKSNSYIVGEAWVGSDYEINRYYQSGVDSFFLFTGAQATGSIASLVKLQSGQTLGKLFTTLQSTYTKGILAPFLGNHDTMRPGSFMPGVENVKMSAGVLSMMNGGTFVYYGEEIGMISKNGTSSDPHKRIAMKWKEKTIYPGVCYTTPEGISIDETYYYYPSVEEQMADENSILNYYKAAMRLRNAFPSIARGTVENHSDGQSSYICVITKTYLDEKITIVFNLDSFEQNVTIDYAALGCSEIVGELYVDNSAKATYDGTGNLTMPPQSIVILK